MDGYRRVADLVDGNAYYWASVNPATYPGYPEKLAEMGRGDPRARRPLDPAGGTGLRRAAGRRHECRASAATVRPSARSSTPRRRRHPDAIGLISWNEFSENTHIEPSRTHGSRYLRLVGDLRGAKLPELRDFDSSEPAATGVSYGLPLLGGVALFLGDFLSCDSAARRAPPPSSVRKSPHRRLVELRPRARSSARIGCSLLVVRGASRHRAPLAADRSAFSA